MKIKVKKENPKSKFIRCQDITITDDNDNKLNSEITKVVITITPDDIVKAQCEFFISEMSGMGDIEVTNTGSENRELIKK